MYNIKQKVYVVTDEGRKKTGRVVAEPIFKDGELTYLCEFGGIQLYVPHSRLNKLNFTVVNGGKI